MIGALMTIASSNAITNVLLLITLGVQIPFFIEIRANLPRAMKGLGKNYRAVIRYPMLPKWMTKGRDKHAERA